MADGFKAKRQRLRVIQNPYTSETLIQRENLDPLDEEWKGTEERKGTQDYKEVVWFCRKVAFSRVLASVSH